MEQRKWPRCYASDQQFRYTPHARVHPAFPPFFESAFRVRGGFGFANSRNSGIFEECGAHSRGLRIVKPVQHTIRLPIALDKTLKALAERHNISVYQMLQRSVKAGVSTLANPPQRDTTSQDIIGEVASIATRIVDVERMLDRALFTSCAAYCHARNASQGTRKSDCPSSEHLAQLAA